MVPSLRALLTFLTCAGLAFSNDNIWYDDLVEALPSLGGKCVAITGTTSGLGYWVAAATARRGAACLIMLNRESDRSVLVKEDMQKLAAPGVAVFSVSCDLQDFSSVRTAATSVSRIAAQFGGLDVLALNAGISSWPDERTVDGFDVLMQTNHLSHVLLTKQLMRSLRDAAAKGREVRVVTHSSVLRSLGGQLEEKYYQRCPSGTLGGDDNKAKWERYHQSKLANIGFALALHSKLRSLVTSVPEYRRFKVLSAAAGISSTSSNVDPRTLVESWPSLQQWIDPSLFMSASDGSCSLLTAMFEPSAQSGDFFEPQEIVRGPPSRVVAEGVPLIELPPQPSGRSVISNQEVCAAATLAKVWRFSETGLGELINLEATPMSEIQGSLAVLNVNFNALRRNTALKTAVETSCKESIAKHSHVLPQDVQVSLSDGSSEAAVQVRAAGEVLGVPVVVEKLHVNFEITAPAQKATMAASYLKQNQGIGALETDLLTSISNLPGIEQASTPGSKILAKMELPFATMATTALPERTGAKDEPPKMRVIRKVVQDS